MLHKASKVHGYHLVTLDGEIGHVDDLLMDEDWTVRYLVVDTSNLWGGKWVVVPSGLIDEIDSPHKIVRVNMTREDVQNCPSIDSVNIELIETLPPTII